MTATRRNRPHRVARERARCNRSLAESNCGCSQHRWRQGAILLPPFFVREAMGRNVCGKIGAEEMSHSATLGCSASRQAVKRFDTAAGWEQDRFDRGGYRMLPKGH